MCGTTNHRAMGHHNLFHLVIWVIFQGITIYISKNCFYRIIYIVRTIQFVRRYLNIFQSIAHVIVLVFEMTDWKKGYRIPKFIALTSKSVRYKLFLHMRKKCFMIPRKITQVSWSWACFLAFCTYQVNTKKTITFIQRRPNVFAIGLTLYICYIFFCVFAG